MKNTLLIIGAFTSLLLLACNKDRNPKSTYYIDGQKYETRQFEAYLINGVAQLVYSGSDQRVGLALFVSHFPKSGTIALSNSTQPSTANIGVILNRKIYVVSSSANSVVSATEENGLGKYVIEPTWLRIRVTDPADSSRAIEGNDSIRFSGTIYESKDKTVR